MKLTQPIHGELALFATTLTTPATARTAISHSRWVFAGMLKSMAIVIDRRFRGPNDSGNGGYSAGRFALAHGGDVVEVTLRLPPPLDTPLVLDGERIVDGDAVVGGLEERQTRGFGDGHVHRDGEHATAGQGDDDAERVRRLPRPWNAGG